ncbi:unnamed protein product, partial [Effrenium voratum]
MWEHDGLCACGKRTYVFSRCPTCIRREAQDAVVEAQERKEREERGDLEELDGAALIEEVGAASNMCEPDGTTEVVGIKTIHSWGGGSLPKSGSGGAKWTVKMPGKGGILMKGRWDKGHSPEIPQLSGDQVEKYPYRTVWAVEPDGTVLTVQNCCKVGSLESSEPEWALQGLNWHCHRSVVNAQCDSVWKTGSKEMSARFNCLIGLIGVPVEVVAWNDGDGQTSVGHRRDLVSKGRGNVLVGFQLRSPANHWDPFELGKKIRVEESRCRPTMVFVVKPSEGPRGVLAYFSKRWVVVDYAHPVGHVYSFEDRSRLAEEAKAAAGMSNFEVTGSLRASWVEAQSKDPSLAESLRKTPEGYKRAADGMLEKEVSLPGGAVSTVPVVPNGVAASSGVTWRKACYLQFHCGVFGAHRSAEKTYALMKRVVWWATMKEDINSWVGKCLTCFKARSRATKVTTKPMKPAADYCWQGVSVDCEGPNKEDYAGNRYSLTYMDCLSHAVYLEPLRALNHAEVRRAFARCVLRSRTLPTLVRSDRGPEFRSAMFAEYCALIGASQWVVHQEVQKMLGIVVKDVARGHTDHWGDLLAVVEYCIDTTPGPHGYTPRDLDRAWSLGVPLEKDLLKSTLEFEPVSDWARKIFGQYKAVSKVVKDHLTSASEARVRLANRYRREVDLKVGDRVVWRAPGLSDPGAKGR